jgi:hypothetical protein
MGQKDHNATDHALYSRFNFDHRLAARNCLGLHDGELYLHPSGRRRHHGSGAVDSGAKTLMTEQIHF